MSKLDAGQAMALMVMPRCDAPSELCNRLEESPRTFTMKPTVISSHEALRCPEITAVPPIISKRSSTSPTG